MSKQILTDLMNEMRGRCLSEAFESEGHTYEMQLMNGEETNWRNSHVILKGISFENKAIGLDTISGMRNPTLAIGIRKIDGTTIESMFESNWDDLNNEVKIAMIGDNPKARKWFIAERFLEVLSTWDDVTLEDLWGKWAELMSRRRLVQDKTKKSSGESGKKENSPLSPSGDQ